MATMKDVAREAGVSVTTVSHILNGTRYVSTELTDKVLAAVDRLEYRPYGLARSLRTKQSRTVGVLIPDNTNPFFAEIARFLEDSFFAQGYNVIICNTERSPEKELTYLRLLNDKAADGLVFVSTGNDSEALDVVHRQRIPAVLIDRDIPSLPMDRIVSDNELGAYMATRHLIDLGHRRIATVTGPDDITSTGDRLSGYSRAMDEIGGEHVVVHGDFQVESGYRAYRLLFGEGALRAGGEGDSGGEGPTAIFSANDLMAFGILHGAAQDGLSVPGDLSVVGFDDIQLASYSVPALTTVHQPKHEIADQTVQHLLRRVHGEADHEPAHVVVAPRLMVRSSTAAPKEAIV